MKNISVIIIGLLFNFYCLTGFCNGKNDDQPAAQPNGPAAGALNITSSPELNTLATIWASEYCKLNPAIKISVSNIADLQTGNSQELCFVSNDFSEGENNGKQWKMVIGRDAIVPVINAKNPMLDEIYHQGISAEEIAWLFANPGKGNWKSVIKGGQDKPISYYVIDNETVKRDIRNFIQTNSSTSKDFIVTTTPEIISALKSDLYAIGFCKLTDIRDGSTNEIIPEVKIFPIDKNGNGRVDNFENIYTNIDTFTRGVWIGKYPRALTGGIYAMSATKPTDKNTLAFLTWVTTDGQKFLNKNGYSFLASVEVKSNVDALSDPEIGIAQDGDKSILSNTWFLTLISLVIIGLAVAVMVRYMRKQMSNGSFENIEIFPVLNENLIKAPKGLYFDKTHTWAFMEKDGNVKIGIDDFLQHITGTITRINMKNAGETVRKGEKILTIIREGKQLNIYAPVSGVIKEQNQSLKADSTIINSAPFTDGWVYLIEPKNWVREIQFLFMGEKYKEWLSDEFSRLKDFFAASVRSNTAVYAHIILQDGGELTDNVLADLGPEVWEDFQTKFIDTSK